MNKVYNRINWQNEPSLDTPINETNLNKIDYAVNEIDNRIITLDTTKATKEQLQTMISSFSLNETTGVITIVKVNGETVSYDLNVEKIPVSFSLSSSGILTMTTADGTAFTADIADIIPILAFNPSSTIAVETSREGINKTYSFVIKNNSITEDMLEVGYLAKIKLETAQSTKNVTDSKNYAELSKSYAIGTDNTIRENDSADNSKYYSEVSKSESTKCESLKNQSQSILDEIIKKIKTAKFTIDFDTGQIIQENEDIPFSFSINKVTGQMECEVIS